MKLFENASGRCIEKSLGVTHKFGEFSVGREVERERDLPSTRYAHMYTMYLYMCM